MNDVNPHRVLFIGNSYTHFNEMPSMVGQLASAAGCDKPLVTTLVTNGGYTLQRHWREQEALTVIREGGWEHVVLQEQSLRPIQNPERMAEYAGRFIDAALDIGAEPLLYATWARRNRPETQQAITDAYRSVEGRGGSRLVPVGCAWTRALAELPHLAFHRPDDSHPTATGSFLTACVFLAALTGCSPEGLPHALRVEGERWVGAEGELKNLEGDDVRALQRIAWDVTKSTNEASDP